jgi:hypothetical protein
MKTDLGSVWRGLARNAFNLSVLLLIPTLLSAQVPEKVAAVDPAPEGPPISIHGVVLNAATGSPLPRALVSVEGDRPRGALTDGEGRFTIPGVPSGISTIDVKKPKFHSPGESTNDVDTSSRLVRVASGMPELSFSLAPDNSITPRVMLSAGVPAEGVNVVALRQMIVNGHASWEWMASNLVGLSGETRLDGLPDGAYLLLTEPEFENDARVKPDCNPDSPKDRQGNASVFYGGSVDMAGAAIIVLKGGMNVEVNLSLDLTAFHLVHISIPKSLTEGNWTISNMLFEHNGQQSLYPLFEAKDRSLCAYLPDGTYTLVVNASLNREEPPGSFQTSQRRSATSAERMGVLEFDIGGHAESSLRMTLAQVPSSPVYVRYLPGPPKPPSREQGDVEFENADRMRYPYIGGVRVNGSAAKNPALLSSALTADHNYEISAAPPGPYWISATASIPGTCIGEASSMGQNLAQSPWIVGPSGAGAPVEIVVRTDCATLTVEAPSNMASESTGEDMRLYVYVIPEFPSIEEAPAAHIEQIGERRSKFEGLTPGTYRVFTFRTPHSLEYHNPVALKQFGAGQQVTLEPGGNATLVVREISK